MTYSSRLKARERDTGRPIRVGLAGAGQMGSGYVAQVQRIAGMEIGAIADVDPNRAATAYKSAGVEPDDVRHTILTDAIKLADADVDAIVDATGVPEVGAALSLAALRAGKHVALLNVECDVTIGYLLTAVARAKGRVYTVCRGDEPAEARLLVEYARDLAFEIVCTGKGKNNPMDQSATPASLAAEAAAKHMNPKMLCSFVDGSKAMIEMVALANGTDLQISKRGFHAPSATVPTLAEIYRLEEDGGILDRVGVVDYCTGPVAPGVFVVVRTDDPVVHEEMSYLNMGPGPYFTLYRPYHLASIEAPLSVSEAVLDGTASIAPIAWNAEVGTAAKRDLQPGDTLDGIGGTTVYGMAEAAGPFKEQNLLPLGLVGGARMVRAVKRGDLLTYDDVEWSRDSVINRLRRLQDQQIAENWSDEETLAAVDEALPAT
ncbi:MAG: SAF domain-containing protein [Nakamurella sp.]